MAKKKLDILQKLSTVTAAMGNIIDSLTGNSSTDAPSIRAVNEALDNTKNQLLTGYEESTGNSYSGSASDYGIEIAKASGNYEQEGTPTPESPIEPKFFEPKNIASSGNNLYPLNNFVNLNENFTIDNDGWFVINHTNNTGGIEFFNIYHKPITELKKNSDYYFTIELEKNIFSGSPTLYINSLEPDSSNNSQFENGNVTFKFDSDNKIVLLTTKENFDSSQYLLRTYLYIPNGSSIDFKFRITLSPIENANFETYKPIYTTPLSLILRALPNGIKDTYENGVITRRVGYIEFDGSEDEDFIFRNQAESPLVQIYVNGAKGNTNNQSLAGYLCNKLKELTPDNLWSSIEVNRFSIGVNDGSKCFFSFRVDGVTESIESFKTWLQSNPIKVWYELATPTTEEVDLPVIPSYYPFTNAWHDSDVEANDLTWHILSAINGIVTNDWGTENLDKKAPSIQSVLDNLRPKQLLKNPDFQVNQRGQSEYNFATNGTYGLDMWQHRQGKYLGALIVTPIKGGGVHIKLGANSGGGLRQVLNGDDFKIGQPYTAVVSINNTQYKGTLNLSNVAQKFIENELFQLEIGIIEGNFNYSLWVKQTGFEGDINYCDLWEGDIAYPHVKKSYQDDLWECMKYVQKLESRVVPLNKTWGNQRNSVLIAYIAVCRTMVSKPTIEVNWSSWIYSSNDSDGHDVPTENCNFTFRVLNNEIDIRITKKDGTSFNKNYDYFVNTGNDGILLSCELL